MAAPVRLYVYDVTQGLARSLSPMLLGRQIDGVWHTGITVYGNEYFFGGGHGISYVPQGQMGIGPPTEILELGNTEIPEDLFNEFLVELSTDRFRGDRYHLLHHNCNNFSNEAAQFLTGKPIPSHITNLPDEVMNTPFGQQLRPMIEAMMGQLNNQGQHPFENTTSSTDSQQQSTPASASRQTQQANTDSDKNKKKMKDDLDLD